MRASGNRPSPRSGLYSDSLAGAAGQTPRAGKDRQNLYQGVKGFLLMVLGDDVCQQLVLALGQLDEGTDTVNVGIGLHIQHVISPCGDSSTRAAGLVAAIHSCWRDVGFPAPALQPRPAVGGRGRVDCSGRKLQGLWQAHPGSGEKSGAESSLASFSVLHRQCLWLQGIRHYSWWRNDRRKSPNSTS